MKPLVNLYKLGRLPYFKALDIQQTLFDKLKNNLTSYGSHGVDLTTHRSIDFKKDCASFQSGRPRNSLILVEHEPVYTIGIRSKDYDDKYVSQLKKELDKHNLEAEVVKTNRGGLITFHGPGQLVAYPIIYLGDFIKSIKNKSIKLYVSALESTIIDTLAKIGLHGAHTVREYPGVWLDGGQRKIAFIGISCKRYVTMHGISINCDCDLSWFDYITSCGIVDKSITSIRQELLLAKQRDGIVERQPIGMLPDCSTMNSADDCSFIDSSIGNLIEGETSRAQQQNREGFNNDIIKARSNVEHISEAFCSSFSQHFNCKFVEEEEAN